MGAQFVKGADIDVFHPKKGDFQVNNIIFEIGGKNKTGQQIKDVEEKKIVSAQ